GAEPPRRRHHDPRLAHARDHGRRGLRDPHQAEPRVHRQLLRRRRNPEEGRRDRLFEISVCAGRRSHPRFLPMSEANKQWKLKARPTGMCGREHFDLVTGEAPSPKPGEAVVRNEYISLDPAMRGWMNDAKSYVPPVGIGEVMRAGSVGRVVASNAPSLAVG